MADVERNTFTWGAGIDASSSAHIGRVLAGELLSAVETELGRPLAVNPELPTRSIASE